MKLTEAMAPFVGTPECRLGRFTKPTAGAVYFCEQCNHFSKTNECPFRRALEQSQSQEGK